MPQKILCGAVSTYSGEQIVGAAIEIADVKGPDAVSARRIPSKLGSRAMLP
jgi:hypothetical protein